MSINVSVPLSITVNSSSSQSPEQPPQQPPQQSRPRFQRPQWLIERLQKQRAGPDLESSPKPLQESSREPSLESSPEPEQTARGLLTWKEFRTDLERHKSLRFPETTSTDPNALESYLRETGQQDDPLELVMARKVALSTTGQYANWTAKMTYNWYFGNRTAFYRKRFAQTRADHPFLSNTGSASNTVPPANRPKLAAIHAKRATARQTLATCSEDAAAQQAVSTRPKRAAAQQAPAAWAALSPRKRQRQY